MGRIPNFRRLRARSAEEQMLATMLVAGLVFAVVSLVAFLRPGGSTSAAARGPELSSPANTNVAAGGGDSLRTRTTQTSTVSGSLDSGPPGGDLTQRLQGLFASVLSPLGFTTSLPRLDPLPPGSVPIQTVSAPGGSSPSFPVSFPPLPGHLPPPVNLPPVTDTLPPTTDTLPPTTVVTLPPTTLPPTTLPPTTLPPTTAPPTTLPPTTLPPTTDTLPPTTDTLPPTTLPPTTDTLPPTTLPPTTDTLPPTTDTLPPTTNTVPPPIP